jgi:hypothetical protein
MTAHVFMADCSSQLHSEISFRWKKAVSENLPLDSIHSDVLMPPGKEVK